MSAALSGIRIIDMTHNQAGPACAQMLAFLGADVIKLEEPKGGDVARTVHADKKGSDSLFFLLFNANKRSLTLNLKTDEGKRLFKRVVGQSDVLLENFGPGPMDRHGNQLGHTVPGTTYACAPGGPNDYVIVLAQPQMWKAMCGAMGRPDLPDDARFATPDARWENRDALNAIVEEWTRKHTKH